MMFSKKKKKIYNTCRRNFKDTTKFSKIFKTPLFLSCDGLMGTLSFKKKLYHFILTNSKLTPHL